MTRRMKAQVEDEDDNVTSYDFDINQQIVIGLLVTAALFTLHASPRPQSHTGPSVVF